MSGARVAVLGAGRMGQAIMAGLLAAEWPADRVVAAESDARTAEEVRSRLGVDVVDPAEAVRGADLVVLAVKPQQVTGVLDSVRDHLSPGATIVSIAAGVSTATLCAHVPDGAAVVRVMPNTPALVGQGVSAVSPAAGCTAESVALATEVLSAIGTVVEVPESLQDAVTAVSGSGPAYVFLMAEAMVDAGVLLGLPRPLAHQLAVETLAGASAMLQGAGEHPAVLRENVTSPGGTTAAAIQVFEESAFRGTVARAMRACRDRSAEIGG